MLMIHSQWTRMTAEHCHIVSHPVPMLLHLQEAQGDQGCPTIGEGSGSISWCLWLLGQSPSESAD